MAKLIYELEQDDFISEASKVEFTISQDLDIYEFHTMCIRLAHSIGFHPDSIDDAFEHSHDFPKQTEEDKEIMKQLLKG